MRGQIMNAATSKFNPLAYAAPALTHGVAELAATGDDKKVLKENRGQAIVNQIEAGKFAMNFIPGGAAAKAIGGPIMDKAIGAAGKSKQEKRKEKTEAQFDKDIAKDFGEGGMFDDGSALVDNIEKENAMAEASKGLDDAVADSNPADIMKQTKSQKWQKGMGQAANIANIAMEGVGLIMNQDAYRKGIQSDKEDIMSQTINTSSNFSYA